MNIYIMQPSSSSSASSLIGGKRRIKKSKSARRSKRGGYSSAATYEMATVGNTNQQWDNVFVRGSDFGAAVQNLSGTQPSVVNGAIPSAANLALIQSAGSKKGSKGTRKARGTRKGKRSKKGGYWGSVLSQAAVPFSLWFAQNRLTRRKK